VPGNVANSMAIISNEVTGPDSIGKTPLRSAADWLTIL